MPENEMPENEANVEMPPQNPQTPAAAADSPATDDNQSVTWTASEYIAHEKSAGWYLTLALVAVGIAALARLITGDSVSAGVVIIGALFLGIYGARQPRQLEYHVSQTGFSVGDKHFAYHEFKSFSLVTAGVFSSIVFMPLRRFAVPLTIYYPPQDEAKIVNLLAAQLPNEEPRRDAVENLMRRIRF